MRSRCHLVPKAEPARIAVAVVVGRLQEPLQQGHGRGRAPAPALAFGERDSHDRPSPMQGSLIT